MRCNVLLDVGNFHQFLVRATKLRDGEVNVHLRKISGNWRSRAAIKDLGLNSNSRRDARVEDTWKARRGTLGAHGTTHGTGGTCGKNEPLIHHFRPRFNTG